MKRYFTPELETEVAIKMAGFIGSKKSVLWEEIIQFIKNEGYTIKNWLDVRGSLQVLLEVGVIVRSGSLREERYQWVG